MNDAGARDRDRRCLRRLAAGEIDALTEIWESYGDRAFRHALWVTGRREDAEDVVQTVFVRLAGLGAALLGVRAPATYLGAMVHHEAVAVSRRRRAHAGQVEPEATDLLAAVPDGEADLDRRRVAGHLAALPAAQREVVLLHLWEGMTFRDIGRATGVSTFTAASRYRLATARLRRALGTGVR